MKTLFILALFVTFFLQGCGGELVHNKEEAFIKNGEYGMTYKGELYSGKYIKYRDDGTFSRVVEKGSYKAGMRDGVWEEHNDKKELNAYGLIFIRAQYEKGSYLDNLKNGVWETYKNGELSGKVSYLRGKENGPAEYYYDNVEDRFSGLLPPDSTSPRVQSKGCYLNGDRVGFWEYYNKDGTLSFREDRSPWARNSADLDLETCTIR